MDLCISDMRVKEENGEVLRWLIQRINKFHSMFGRGRGFVKYKGFTKERELYEGLAKAYERMRETSDEEKETRYMIKGIELCDVLYILSLLMDMMIRLQALSTLLWSVTVFWPRIRQKLTDAKEEIEDQLV